MTDLNNNKIAAKNIIKCVNYIQEKDKDTQEVVREYTEEKYKFENTKEIEIKQSSTRVDVDFDKTEWTNNVQNDVTITATLVTNGPEYNLFKNPVLEIKMPAEVEKVVLGDVSLLYDDNLIVKSADVVEKDGVKVIRIVLNGVQDKYSVNSLVSGANVIIPATVIVKKDIASTDSVVGVVYANESGVVNDYERDGLASKSVNVKIVSRENNIAEQIQREENNESNESGKKYGELLTLRQEKEVCQKQYQNEKKELDLRIAVNERAAGAVKKIAAKSSEKEKQYQWVRALSNTANGALSGQDRIMLETYVQTAFFDRIIIRANTRFMQMTSGQFELVRAKTADNLRAQSGLELNVIDHYNGSIRSVKSLSGGESFKASLAMALGLSDEIQSQTGGIQIDTMFIDEGFGSLDENSLEQAIDVLLRLSESNRLVGIISHVGELKERIGRQIVVTKTPDGGSHARIVADN